MASKGRNTSIRDKHRKIIAKDEPPCGICGQPIEYNAPHLDPGEFTVDHIVPIAQGGTDTLDNKQAAHRRCNIILGASLKGEFAAGIVTHVTKRCWW